ncbi:hypothetical protein DOY81_009127 [Sarcophaga bullata]|nr:hypothetical protein DOY81_009127 [Sarcophaga bullata]
MKIFGFGFYKSLFQFHQANINACFVLNYLRFICNKKKKQNNPYGTWRIRNMQFQHLNIKNINHTTQVTSSF